MDWFERSSQFTVAVGCDTRTDNVKENKQVKYIT